MKKLGFLSFGHWSAAGGSQTRTAADTLLQSIELAVEAERIGIDGAYFRVHHFARQLGSPFPLLAAIGARTRRIEIGTAVIDMRYENPLHLAEEIASRDLLTDRRIAIGISRGSPEQARRGWEAFGYAAGSDERGTDLAHAHTAQLLDAVRGVPQADLDTSNGMAPGASARLRIEPHSPGVDRRLWWGAGSRETAEWTARQGLNLMSSTLLTEATGEGLAALQAEQIRRYREAWRRAGHDWTPRVSVSRSIFPVVSETDRKLFALRGKDSRDYVGVIDGLRSTFGRTYAAEPDVLIEQLARDEALHAADTLMLTIPSQLGVDYNLHILQSFAEHVAPALGWQPSTAGPVTGYALEG